MTGPAAILYLAFVLIAVLLPLLGPERERRYSLIGWAFGHGLPEPTRKSDDGMGLLGTVFAGVLAEAFGLVSALYERKAPRMESLIAYGILSLATAGGAVAVMRSTAYDKHHNPFRRFDRGTLVAARWTLLWSILIPSMFIYLGYNDKLPAQEIVPVKATFDSWEAIPDGEVGIRVLSQISRVHFDGKLPRGVDLFVTIDPEFAATWRVVAATQNEGLNEVEKDLRTRLALNPNPNEAGNESRTSFMIGLYDLEPEKDYLFILRLRLRDPEALVYSGNGATAVALGPVGARVHSNNIRIQEGLRKIRVRKDGPVSLVGISGKLVESKK